MRTPTFSRCDRRTAGAKKTDPTPTRSDGEQGHVGRSRETGHGGLKAGMRSAFSHHLEILTLEAVSAL